jgi:hypothetical protein
MAQQRVHINPNQIPGYRPTPMQTYMPEPIGRRPGGPGSNAGFDSNQGDFLSKVKGFSSRMEDMMEAYTQPVKPYIPALARFLIVVTFIEDAIRIITQWSDQLWYLQK